METLISANTDRFLIALEFSSADLEVLQTANGFATQLVDNEVSVTFKPLEDIISNDEVFEWLDNGLLARMFMIVDPREGTFTHRLFLAPTSDARESTFYAVILAKETQEIVASLPLYTYVPLD